MEMVTCWYRLKDKIDTARTPVDFVRVRMGELTLTGDAWDYNHLEDGHSLDASPAPKAGIYGTVSWNPRDRWRKEWCVLVGPERRVEPV